MILGFGNPAAWWFAIPAMSYVAARAVRAQRVASADAVIVLGFLFAYAPWLALAGGRTMLLFYLVPALPFIYLALARAATTLMRSGLGRALVAAWIVVVAAMTVFAYPLVSAGRVDLGSWRTTIGIARPTERPTCDQLMREPRPWGEPQKNC
jgi:dolichyl-phosphate-mannose--protein O-mannosyl transferase